MQEAETLKENLLSFCAIAGNAISRRNHVVNCLLPPAERLRHHLQLPPGGIWPPACPRRGLCFVRPRGGTRREAGYSRLRTTSAYFGSLLRKPRSSIQSTFSLNSSGW